MVHMSNQAHIYALHDPNRNIAYVGYSSEPEKRRTAHVSTARSLITRPCYRDIITDREYWLLDMLSRGERPILHILDSCNYKDGREHEDIWMQIYIEDGYKLVNMRFNAKSKPIPYVFNVFDWRERFMSMQEKFILSYDWPDIATVNQLPPEKRESFRRALLLKRHSANPSQPNKE